LVKRAEINATKQVYIMEDSIEGAEVMSWHKHLKVTPKARVEDTA